MLTFYLFKIKNVYILQVLTKNLLILVGKVIPNGIVCMFENLDMDSSFQMNFQIRRL